MSDVATLQAIANDTHRKPSRHGTQERQTGDWDPVIVALIERSFQLASAAQEHVPQAYAADMAKQLIEAYVAQQPVSK